MSRKILIGSVLGAWLGCSVFMWAVATQNFRIVDRLLADPSPQFTSRTSPLPPGDARVLMRYQASEVNRLFFERWGWTQLAVGIVLAGLVLGEKSAARLRLSVFLMLGIAAALQFAVVPEVVHIGRIVDFLPRSPAPPQMAVFWRLHAAYTGFDMLKVLIGLFALAQFLRGPAPAAAPAREGTFGAPQQAAQQLRG